MEIGQMMRAQRLRLRMTQVDLAARCGMNVAVVRRLEAGQSIPREAVMRLAKEMDMPEDAISGAMTEPDMANDGFIDMPPSGSARQPMYPPADQSLRREPQMRAPADRDLPRRPSYDSSDRQLERDPYATDDRMQGAHSRRIDRPAPDVQTAARRPAERPVADVFDDAIMAVPQDRRRQMPPERAQRSANGFDDMTDRPIEPQRKSQRRADEYDIDAFDAPRMAASPQRRDPRRLDGYDRPMTDQPASRSARADDFFQTPRTMDQQPQRYSDERASSRRVPQNARAPRDFAETEPTPSRENEPPARFDRRGDDYDRVRVSEPAPLRAARRDEREFEPSARHADDFDRPARFPDQERRPAARAEEPRQRAQRRIDEDQDMPQRSRTAPDDQYPPRRETRRQPVRKSPDPAAYPDRTAGAYPDIKKPSDRIIDEFADDASFTARRPQRQPRDERASRMDDRRRMDDSRYREDEPRPVPDSMALQARGRRSQGDRRDRLQARSYGDMLDTMIDMAHMSGWETVLDVGSFDGSFAARLAGQCRFVVAMDNSAVMVDRSRNALRSAGVRGFDAIQGDGRRMPIASESFDVVFVNMLLHHVVSPGQVISEAYRVLKPGGKLIISELMPADDPSQQRIQNAVEVLKNSTHVKLISMEELSRAMNRAEFDIVDRRVMDQEWEFSRWVDVMGVTSRVAPLQALMRSLALQGNRAGMDLDLDDAGRMSFIYRWMFVLGVKENWND